MFTNTVMNRLILITVYFLVYVVIRQIANSIAFSKSSFYVHAWSFLMAKCVHNINKPILLKILLSPGLHP